MRWFVVPYAYGLDRDKSGLPDAEARDRCDVAFRVAYSLSNATIVLSAGMPGYCQRLGSPHLAAASQKYLLLKGWPEEKILTNPKGKDTVTETEATMEVIGNSRNASVMATTTWYHAFRVWLVWLISGKMVRLRVSRYMARRTGIFREMLAIPKSIVQALWRKALKL